MIRKKNNSFYTIIKSTGLLGGSQLVSILVNIVRTKVIAVLLGSSGIGLVSIYQSIIDLIKSFATLGMETAAVKEIAVTKEIESLRLRASIINRAMSFLACLGGILCLALGYPISIWAFDSDSYASSIALISVCVFFSILSAKEIILLQGMHRVELIVKATICWNSIGLAISLPLYYFLRFDAIVIVLILISAISYFVNYFYRKKTGLILVKVPLKVLFKEISDTAKLGIFILSSVVLSQLTLFLIKSLVINGISLDDLGMVQACLTISSVYMALILSAMGSDFYPRLSAIIGSNILIRRLVNEQLFFILLVSVPTIIALLIFSKFVLTILYSDSFIAANNLLHWILVGSFLKAISWTFGFILICKNKGFLFLSSDLIFSAIYLAISYLFVNKTGIEAIGIGYVIGYTTYLIIVYLLSRKVCNFRWKEFNLKTGIISILLLAITFYFSHYNDEYVSYGSIILLIISASYSLRLISRQINFRNLFERIKNK